MTEGAGVAPAGPGRKRYRAGTHRTRPPDETVAMVRGFAPVLGITRVANVTGLDTIGIPVVMTVRPNSRSLSVSQGKGVTLDAARASGLMEALELYHAERSTVALRLGSYDELRFSRPVADPDLLPRAASGRFRPGLRMLWTEAVDLLSGESVWLPYELIHLDCTRPTLPGAGAFQCSSNGLASGNHLWEAINHAVCEVVERDALDRFESTPWEQQERRRLRLETVDDPDCRWLLDRYAAAEVAVAVWETTGATGVASFTCGISDGGSAPHGRPGTFYGMGCHPAREIALSRALTEAAQVRLTLISGARDDLRRAHYAREMIPEAAGRERNRLDRSPGRVGFAEVPTADFDDLEAEGRWLLDRVASAGFGQVLLVDLTHPAFGVPVVYVVIPGTRGVGGLALIPPTLPA